jgi:hypothetical protein
MAELPASVVRLVGAAHSRSALQNPSKCRLKIETALM